MYRSSLLLSIFFLCISCSSHNKINNFDAVVDAGYKGITAVNIDGIPIYSTLSQVLAVIPEMNEHAFRIFIKNGIYFEKLSIDKPNVFLKGESRDGTIITYNATGDSRSGTGVVFGTRGSYTVQISAPGFRAENLTIENSFNYPANAAKDENDPTRIQNPQAVALFTTTGSDRVVFVNCKLRGYQDTLFADAGRHYFYNCQILGHVDFIFGAGQAVFEKCEIISRNRQKKNPTGYITAPSTPIAMPFGFLFTGCRLVRESPDVAPGSVRLGRPWHPDADPKVSGSSIFKNCFMDDHIGPEGYAPISGRDSSGRRIWFEVKADSRFFEFGSFGPGAIASPTRPKLDSLQARWYTESNVLNGWLPVIKSN